MKSSAKTQGRAVLSGILRRLSTTTIAVSSVAATTNNNSAMSLDGKTTEKMGQDAAGRARQAAVGFALDREPAEVPGGFVVKEALEEDTQAAIQHLLTLPTLGRQTPQRSPPSRPGAYSVENSRSVSLEPVHEASNHHADSSLPELGSEIAYSTAIMAQLVDEDAAEAAQMEIDHLRQQLSEMRARQAQHQIVLAEPLPQEESDDAPLSTSASARQRLANPKKQLLGLSEQGRETVRGDPYPRRMRYSDLTFKLHSREKEVGILQDCLCNQEQKQLVMISGYSGSGKTVLANSLKPMVEEQEGLFVSGKFDLYLRDQPYFAFIVACQQICTAVSWCQVMTCWPVTTKI